MIFMGFFFQGHAESDVTISENLENVSKSNMQQENEIGK